MSAPADVVRPVGGRTDATTGYAWQRLSPRMLAVHPIQELLRGSPALIALLLLGHGKANADYWTIAGIGVVLAIGVLRWLTTTYRITPQHVQVRRGILRRSVLSAPRDRIRSVDLTRHWLHRLLGLARVTVGTGTSDRKGDGGLKLDALSLEQATELREQLLHGRSGVDAAATANVATKPNQPAGDVLVAFSPSWLRYGPLSLSGLVFVFIAVAFLSQFVAAGHVDPADFGPFRAFAHHLQAAPIGLAVAEVVGLGAVVVASLSTLRYLLRYWGFRVTRTGQGTLAITHGLIQTRSTTVEECRIRGVEISQSLVLRLFGAARCVAITTGLSISRGASGGGSLLLPAAPAAQAGTVAAAVLRDPAPVTATVVKHGRLAHRRRYTRALGLATIVTGLFLLLALTAGWPDWLWQGSLALYPLSLPLAADRYRNLGHAFVDGRLVSARGSLVRRRSVLTGEGVVGWKMRRTFFQRRVGLMTLTATTAAGRQGYPVSDIEHAAGVALADQVTPGLLLPFLAES